MCVWLRLCAFVVCRYFWGAAGTVMPTVTATVNAQTGGIGMYATNLWDGTDASLPNALNTSSCIQKITHSGSLSLAPNPLCTNNNVCVYV